jgi:hypothetical protein
MRSFTDYLNEKMDPRMDPRKHAVERDGKFVVVDKDGETVKTFDDKEAAEKYAVANHDKLMEGCGCDGTNEDVSSKDAGRIGAAISNRKDLPASEKNVARRSLQRKVARAQRREKAFNVNADSGSRYRVGTKRPTDDTDPKHKGLRRNDAIAKTLKSYGTNEDVEQVDELKMPRRDERGNIKSRKVRAALQAGSLRASDKDHDHMDKSFKSSGDKQIDHMNKSIAAGERSNDRFKKALKKESVEEAKKKIKVKLDPKKKIGYEVRSVGPGGKTTVTKRRDMPDKEDVGEASGAWQRKEGKNKEGGLNAAGRASYERENPGSDLKAPVSAEQAKKSKGGKAAKRRKSFCARMGGMKGAMKDEKGRPTRKALALRKWDC